MIWKWLILITTIACASCTIVPNSHYNQVRTTAYTHNERDHYKYGRSNAIGKTLQAGNVNSAACDWSFLPVGTKFRIRGDSTLYVIDDYGSALVGTRTIDIYRPSRQSMNNWGTRVVDIDVVCMGSYQQSIDILTQRQNYRHTRKMLTTLTNR